MISINNVSKSFPGVRALDSVNFRASAGEIHGLVGENGAGKSTLIKIVSGAYKPTGGDILVDGVSRHWKSPQEAKRAGIYVIYQEFVLFPALTVAENIFVGRQPRNRFGVIDHSLMRRRALAALDLLGHRLEPDARVDGLSVADQQMVEIARALAAQAKVLIFDEPTAVLSGREADLLAARMRQLRDAGVCIIYVSHRLEEVLGLCDRVTVLKDGRWVATTSVRDLDREALVEQMVGRPLSDIYPLKAKMLPGRVVLSAIGVTSPPRVHNASIEVRAGEIVGLGGLIGSGRTEFVKAIFGAQPRSAGVIKVDDVAIEPNSPKAAIRSGIGLLTEDRKSQGLFMQLDIAANISGPVLSKTGRGMFVDRKLEVEAARREMSRFRIAGAGPRADVAGLSGGNQQKVLIGRWSGACDKVLILDEPTRGVDVGARVEIYGLMRELANAGLGILMISSEMPELIGMSDRVVVMRDGAISGELAGDEMTEQGVMRLAAAARPTRWPDPSLTLNSRGPSDDQY